MRLLSTAPEFSWFGTSMIVGFSAVFGAGVGIAAAARGARGWRRLLRLGFLPGMVLFAGQGMVFLPALLVGGPLLRRRALVARAVAVLALTGPAVLLWWDGRLDEETMNTAPLRVQVVLLVGMPLLSAALAWAGSLMWGPVPQSDSPDLARSRRRSDSSLEAPAGPA
jgi:hypothetical protein